MNAFNLAIALRFRSAPDAPLARDADGQEKGEGDQAL